MIARPSKTDLANYARLYKLDLSPDDLEALALLSEGIKASYDRIEELVDERTTIPINRAAGRTPRPDENPYNAWAWISRIQESASGPLSGVRIGIKDNICVAGLPLRNGSRVFDGFIPQQDATVVSRILAAGGNIVGKTTCEDICFSGGSHTSHPAPVLNPFDQTRSAGGSSSGAAAAIAAGDVRMCIGGDQGGSVRTPASWCGVVGLKPTYGLVPYTGAFALEPTVDHLGPMGRNVSDVALLLSIIAGADGLDPRQTPTNNCDYISAVNLPLRDLRIGVVKEGFGRPESLGTTDAAVERALSRLASSGAKIEDVSIPWHLDGYHLSAPILIEGANEFIFAGNSLGYGLGGHHSYDVSAWWRQAWRNCVNELPEIGKLSLLLGTYMRDTYGGWHYGKAQNLRAKLRKAYDTALGEFDLLAMPTTPMTATRLSDGEGGFAQKVEAGLNMEGNTAPFDMSGHPAISVPCGLANGLPVGLMFVARHFEERSALRAAAAFERLGDWKTM